MKRLLWCVLALGSGCTCGVPNASQLTFPCATAADCDAGQLCSDAGACVAASACPAPADCLNPQCLGAPCSGGTSQGCCSGTCTDVFSDSQHCGLCNLACATGETCQSGRCTCGAGSCPGGSTPQVCDAGVCFCTQSAQCSTGGNALCNLQTGMCQPDN